MPLDTEIALLSSRASACTNILWEVEDGLDWRSPTQFDLLGHGGVGYIAIANRAVLADLIEAMQHFVYGFNSSFNYLTWFNVHQGLLNLTGGGSLADWVLIYAAAPDDQRNAHRLMLDAYQASMYSKPFDQEYHALWVQRFKEWA